MLGIVATADKADEIALASGLCKEMRIDPHPVGVDPTNRGGQGVSMWEVALLANDIVEDGWSWGMVTHATCIEERPGQSMIQDFNEKLVAGTDLAPVAHDSIRYGSLSCGHTNQILRAMAASMPADVPLVTENGRYSMARIRSRDVELAKAVNTGLSWKAYSWRTRLWYPTLPELLQSARNMSSTTLRKQGEMEGLLKLHRSSLMTKGLSANGVPLWHLAKANLLKTRPPFSDKVDAMIAFVATKSGGDGGEYLKYLNRWHNNFVRPSQRAGVPAALYTALASCPCQYLAFAILEAAWGCPWKYVTNMECRWVTAGEVASLTKVAGSPESSRLRAAELVLADARARLGEGGCDKLSASNGMVQVFGRFDIHVARYVLDRQEVKQAIVFETLLEICKSFVAEATKVQFEGLDAKAWEGFGVQTLAGEMIDEGANSTASKKLVKTQAAHAKAQASDTSDKKASLPLAQINAQGEVVTPLWQLRQKGFDLGTLITFPKKTPVDTAGALEEATEAGLSADEERCSYVITDTDPALGAVVLTVAGGEEKRFVFAKDILAFAKACKGRATLEVPHPRWPTGRIMDQRVIHQAYWTSQGQCALGMLAHSLKNKVSDQCEILLKPSRSVRVKRRSRRVSWPCCQRERWCTTPRRKVKRP